MVSEVKHKFIPDSLVALFQENVENQLLHTRGLALYFPGVLGTFPQATKPWASKQYKWPNEYVSWRQEAVDLAFWFIKFQNLHAFHFILCLCVHSCGVSILHMRTSVHVIAYVWRLEVIHGYKSHECQANRYKTPTLYEAGFVLTVYVRLAGLQASKGFSCEYLPCLFIGAELHHHIWLYIFTFAWQVWPAELMPLYFLFV